LGRDEDDAVRRLRELQAAIAPIVAANRGHTFNTAGDAMLMEFSSSVAALDSAMAIQEVVGLLNRALDGEDKMLLRIGVHVGEVIVESGDVFGEVVNVASRLEGLAEPGGVYVSHACYAQIRRRLAVDFADLGEQRLKNIAESVRVYAARPPWPDGVPRAVSPGSTENSRRPSVASVARNAANRDAFAAGSIGESEDQRQVNSGNVLPWPGRRRA
jgi:class 3 adenylate cyclase